jgi:hypothetical protein
MPKPTRTTDRRLGPNKPLIPHKGGIPLPKPQEPPVKKEPEK